MKKKVLEKLDQVEWITPDTKHSAIEKINKLDGKFIGSEMFFNYTLLQQRYHGVRNTGFDKVHSVKGSFPTKLFSSSS